MSQLNFSSKGFLQRLRNKDPEVVTLLVESYTSHLLMAAMGKGLAKDIAEELVQSVWFAFFDRIQAFEGRSHIRTYLFGILYNKIKERFRDQARRVEQQEENLYEQFFESLFDKTGHWIHQPVSPDKMVWLTQSNQAISDCLSVLPERQQTIFVLKEVDGESSNSIAEQLGVTSNHIGVMLYRAKNLLRRCLEGKSISREDI